MEVNAVTVLTAISTLLIGIFGKDFYSWKTRQAEIDGDSDCQKRIRELEIEMANEKLKTNQIVTGVDMLLTMFEQEFKDDLKYMSVIEKVREFIKTKTNIDE